MINLTSFSAPRCPAIAGMRSAVSAAHPLAVAAGQQLLIAGANAINALIASQAAIAVVASEACGLGGDAFLLVHEGA